MCTPDLSAERTNTTQIEFHETLMDSLFSQVVTIVPGTFIMLWSLLHQAEDLYSKGTRWFLFLTHTPIDRTTVFIERDPEAAAIMGTDITGYNAQLTYA
ncbi:uncharacterized protein F5891DRAFT_1067073 [Suillus fuscotomentosus]|uniref:Uncharacterized protein n=1 Tax=Suillus fuscotomentosus TaxID=1912939 RepID=A0AAD4DSR7_9AGAM|nr:uncharacterized protein F5891DRAFT_1067073 [Suillus fuscotomentosus]KAG1893260.1 hypothetical protein F5891DRAFT_1067073 [Suillus fuscotomentosus]